MRFRSRIPATRPLSFDGGSGFEAQTTVPGPQDNSDDNLIDQHSKIRPFDEQVYRCERINCVPELYFNAAELEIDGLDAVMVDEVTHSQPIP